VNVVSSPSALGLLVNLFRARRAVAAEGTPASAKIAGASADGLARAAFALRFDDCLSVAGYRGGGRSSGKGREFMRVLAERILPQSRVELVPYLGLAVTAGLCEEFLYRGFAMAALTREGLPVWGVVLLSSVLFGLAHLYQGRGGLVSTLVIGTVFGTARIAYDGVVPVMLWHIAVDAVAGVAGPKYLVRTVLPTGKGEVPGT
jgi:hypothetical protein